MNGISTAISKYCCPVYSFGSSSNSKINFGTNNKNNNFGTSKKMEDLIPGRLSNLPHLRITPLIAIKPLLKHRAYSCKDITTGSMSKAPEVSGSVAPYGLLGLFGIIGLALPKAWEVVAQSISTRGGIEENRRTAVSISWHSGQNFVNKSRDPSRAMACEIFVAIEEVEKIPEITEEIRNMMRSEPLIYLEKEQPYCYLSGVNPFCLKLSFGCNLKHVSEKDLFFAEEDIWTKLVEIIEKHGGVIVDDEPILN